jgi:hypothetical protein
MALPTEPTTATADPTGRPVLIFGAEKIGKSTFASQMPKPIFFATESGHDHLEIFKVDVRGYDDFAGPMKELAKEKQKRFQTVVIDTLDSFYEYLCAEVCKNSGQEPEKINEGVLSHGKGYAQANGKLQVVLRGIVDLGFGLCLVSHQKTKTIHHPSGSEHTRVVPDLPERALNVVVGLVDFILFCDVEDTINSDDKLEHQHVIRLRPGAWFIAGGRSPVGRELPDSIPLSWDSLLEVTK